MSAVLEAREPSARYLPSAQAVLVRQFELLATAHGGVARLRNLIVSLAVRGGLSQREPTDATLAPDMTYDGDAPYELPKGWRWQRLGELQPEFQNGAASRGDAGGQPITVLRLADIRNRRVSLAETRTVPIRREDIEKYLLRDGDILITRVNGSADIVGQFNLVEGGPRAIYCDHFIRLRVSRQVLEPHYLALFASCVMVRKRIGDLFISTAGQKTVNQGHIASLPIAIPPLRDQARIVARVNELMQLCDALEAKGRVEAQQHARLLETLLGTLTESTTPEELAANWQRVAEHFDLLLDRPEAVDVLEQTILQLAVRGTLVRQDANDEPVSLLLRRIRSDKNRLVAEGKIKSDKPLATLDSGEVPFDIPVGWDWMRLGSIAGIERGGSPRPIEAFLTDSPNGLNWIKIGDTEKGGKYITSARERIRPEGLSKTRKVYPGDFLLTNSMSFGRPYITQIEGCIHDGWLRISPPSSLNKDYLYLLLSSSFMRELFVAAAAGGVVQNLNADKVRGVPIPLPPLAEQTRIVTRVTELLRLCADLRQRLAASQATQSRLAEALVESALA